MYPQQVPLNIPAIQPSNSAYDAASDLNLAGVDGTLDPRQIAQDTIHLPDSVAPDDRACALQAFDLTTPDFDLPSAWSSDFPLAGVQALVQSQGLNAWLPYDHPTDVALVDDDAALNSVNAANAAESLAAQPERSMPARPGDLSDQAQDALQDYQQSVPQSYPQAWEDQLHAFSHRALHLCLLDDGLEQQK